jgi:hypothetical protein
VTEQILNAPPPIRLRSPDGNPLFFLLGLPDRVRTAAQAARCRDLALRT